MILENDPNVLREKKEQKNKRTKEQKKKKTKSPRRRRRKECQIGLSIKIGRVATILERTNMAATASVMPL